MIEVKTAADDFVQASCIGEIDGKLYAISTDYIDSSEGIQQIDLPTDDCFYVTRFAYYKGRVYYAEKHPAQTVVTFGSTAVNLMGAIRKSTLREPGLPLQ